MGEQPLQHGAFLLLAQALELAGVPRVSAQLQGGCLTVRTDWELSVAELQQALLDPVGASPPVRLLARALHSALHRQPEKVSLRGAGISLRWREGRLQVSRDFAAEGLELTLPVTEPLPEWRCRFLRTDWRLNQRPLRAHRPQFASWYRYRTEAFLLGRRLLSGAGLHRAETAVQAGAVAPTALEGLGLSWQRHYLALGQALYWHNSDSRSMQVFCVSGSYLGPWSVLIEIALELEGPSEVVVVKHGVCLQPFAFELGCPGAVAYIGGDDLATDLSGLTPVQNQQLLDRLAGLSDEVAQLVAQIRAGLHLLRPKSGGAGPGFTAVRSVVGGLLGVTAAFGDPISLGIIGLSLGALVPTGKRLMRERVASNRDELTALVAARLPATKPLNQT